MNESRVYGIKREPKQQRSRLLIEKICSATLELVAQRGLHKVNANLITTHAGVDIHLDSLFYRLEKLLD